MQVWKPPKAIVSRVALAPCTWECHAVAARLLGAAPGSEVTAGVAAGAAAARHLRRLRARLDPRRDTRLTDASGPWTNRVFLVASR